MQYFSTRTHTYIHTRFDSFHGTLDVSTFVYEVGASISERGKVVARPSDLAELYERLSMKCRQFCHG